MRSNARLLDPRPQLQVAFLRIAELVFSSQDSFFLNSYTQELLLLKLMHLSMLSRGEGGGRAGGDFDILSKFFVKNHSPGITYFVKKHKNPHPRAGELCQMFLPRGNAIHSRHPPRPNQTKKCTSLSYKEKLRKTEIILPINSTKSNSHKY